MNLPAAGEIDILKFSLDPSRPSLNTPEAYKPLTPGILFFKLEKNLKFSAAAFWEMEDSCKDYLLLLY